MILLLPAVAYADTEETVDVDVEVTVSATVDIDLDYTTAMVFPSPGMDDYEEPTLPNVYTNHPLGWTIAQRSRTIYIWANVDWTLTIEGTSQYWDVNPSTDPGVWEYKPATDVAWQNGDPSGAWHHLPWNGDDDPAWVADGTPGEPDVDTDRQVDIDVKILLSLADDSPGEYVYSSVRFTVSAQ